MLKILRRKEDPIEREKRLEKAREYSKKNWAQIKNDPERHKKYKEVAHRRRDTVEGIYDAIRLRRRGKKTIDFKLGKNQFIEWHKNQEQKCSYCNLTIEEIRLLPPPFNRENGRRRFSIDRKDNDIGYTVDNIALSCFTCNTIKNNFLTYEEMIKIGKDIIEPKLRLILSKII